MDDESIKFIDFSRPKLANFFDNLIHIGALHCAEWFDSKNTTVCRGVRIPGIPGILECTYHI